MKNKTRILKEFMEDKWDIDTIDVEDTEYSLVFGIVDNNFVIGCTTQSQSEPAFKIIPFTIKESLASKVFKLFNSVNPPYHEDFDEKSIISVSNLIKGLHFDGKCISGIPEPLPEGELYEMKWLI